MGNFNETEASITGGLFVVAVVFAVSWYQYYRWNECRAHHPFFYCFMEMRR